MDSLKCASACVSWLYFVILNVWNNLPQNIVEFSFSLFSRFVHRIQLVDFTDLLTDYACNHCKQMCSVFRLVSLFDWFRIYFIPTCVVIIVLYMSHSCNYFYGAVVSAISLAFLSFGTFAFIVFSVVLLYVVVLYEVIIVVIVMMVFNVVIWHYNASLI